MNAIGEYIFMLGCTIPVYSGISCAMLVMLSYNNSLTSSSLGIKKSGVVYFLVATFGWLSIFFYDHFPVVFVVLNVPIYLSFLYVQVLLYRLFYIFTNPPGAPRFPRWHYIAPALLCGVMLIWSFFVPWDVQLELVANKGTYIPAGYEAYARYFMSKPPVRLLFGIVYLSLTGVRLTGYYRRTSRSDSLVRNPANWVITICILTLTSIFSSIIATVMSRTNVYASHALLIPALAIFGQHIVLAYHIVQGDYRLYSDHTEPEIKPANGRKAIPLLPVAEREETVEEEEPVRLRKTYTRKEENPLTKKKFEAWVNKNRPYLEPDCRITDLMKALDINRTYLSNFINSTYGVHFNRYMNRRRLEELNRLTKLSSGRVKPLRELVRKAGFYDYRHYKRALQVEQEVSLTSSNKEKE